MSKADVKFPSSGGGGGLQYWIESEDATTQQSTIFTPSNSATDVNAVLLPKGTGANLAQTPDGTATGGNARGHYATDWQKRRNAADEVANGNDNTISGGRNNKTSSTDSTIGGGRNNTASGSDSTVSGGRDNTASGNDSTVGGGQNNVASGTRSNITGGQSNTASTDYTTITGGYLNEANAENTRAAGYKSKANRPNMDVFGWDALELAQHVKKGGTYSFNVVTPGAGGNFTCAEYLMTGTNCTFLLNLKVILRTWAGTGYLGSGTVETFDCTMCIKRVAGVSSLVGSAVVNNSFGDFLVSGTSLSFGIVGATLQVNANIPLGSGTDSIVEAYYVFEGLEQRI